MYIHQIMDDFVNYECHFSKFGAKVRLYFYLTIKIRVKYLQKIREREKTAPAMEEFKLHGIAALFNTDSRSYSNSYGRTSVNVGLLLVLLALSISRLHGGPGKRSVV
jgi:hypothetical protein